MGRELQQDGGRGILSDIPLLSLTNGLHYFLHTTLHLSFLRGCRKMRRKWSGAHRPKDIGGGRTLPDGLMELLDQFLLCEGVGNWRQIL